MCSRTRAAADWCLPGPPSPLLAAQSRGGVLTHWFRSTGPSHRLLGAPLWGTRPVSCSGDDVSPSRSWVGAQVRIHRPSNMKPSMKRVPLQRAGSRSWVLHTFAAPPVPCSWSTEERKAKMRRLSSHGCLLAQSLPSKGLLCKYKEKNKIASQNCGAQTGDLCDCSS